MAGRSTRSGSGFLIGRLRCAFLVVLPLASLWGAQTEQAPQDLVKNAEALQQAGKLDQAIEAYRLFLKQYPDIAPVRSNLGAALAAAGHYEEAIVEYQRALQLQPLPQIRLNLALAYYKADKLDLAVEELERVLQEMPNELRPAMLLADCYLRLGENKKVIALLDPLESTHGDDLGITYMLGTALVRDGQVARGRVIIDKILRNGDSAEARLLLGTTKLLGHDAPGALEDLRMAVDLNPQLPSAHAYYGRALQATADLEGAEKAYRAELSLNPNDFDATFYLGVLLKGRQQYEEALPFLQHALEIRPGDVGVRYQIALLHVATRRLDLAQQEFEALAKDSPDFLDPHLALAALYYRLKRKQDGDREQAIVERLTAEKQARESEAHLGSKTDDKAKTPPLAKPPG